MYIFNNIKASFKSKSDNVCIRYEDGKFTKEDGIYWAEFKFEIPDQTIIEIVAQFDCGDCWCWYNLGGDGECSDTTAEHFFNRDDTEFVEWLEFLLGESYPDREITIGDMADYIRENWDDFNLNKSVIESITKLCPEKSNDWATVLAFHCREGIESYGDFEVNLQIYQGLSKGQTLELAHVL